MFLNKFKKKLEHRSKKYFWKKKKRKKLLTDLSFAFSSPALKYTG